MRKRHTSKGFLSTIQRKSGAVLVYRWYDPGTDGRPTERKRVLGLAKDFRSEAAARREVQRLGLRRRSGDGPSTFKELVDHWLQKECSMETDPSEGNRCGRLALTTQKAEREGSGSRDQEENQRPHARSLRTRHSLRMD